MEFNNQSIYHVHSASTSKTRSMKMETIRRKKASVDRRVSQEIAEENRRLEILQKRSERHRMITDTYQRGTYIKRSSRPATSTAGYTYYGRNKSCYLDDSLSQAIKKLRQRKHYVGMAPSSASIIPRNQKNYKVLSTTDLLLKTPNHVIVKRNEKLQESQKSRFSKLVNERKCSNTNIDTPKIKNVNEKPKVKFNYFTPYTFGTKIENYDTSNLEFSNNLSPLKNLPQSANSNMRHRFKKNKKTTNATKETISSGFNKKKYDTQISEDISLYNNQYNINNILQGSVKNNFKKIFYPLNNTPSSQDESGFYSTSKIENINQNDIDSLDDVNNNQIDTIAEDLKNVNIKENYIESNATEEDSKSDSEENYYNKKEESDDTICNNVAIVNPTTSIIDNSSKTNLCAYNRDKDFSIETDSLELSPEGALKKISMEGKIHTNQNHEINRNMTISSNFIELDNIPNKSLLMQSPSLDTITPKNNTLWDQQTDIYKDISFKNITTAPNQKLFKSVVNDSIELTKKTRFEKSAYPNNKKKVRFSRIYYADDVESLTLKSNGRNPSDGTIKSILLNGTKQESKHKNQNEENNEKKRNFFRKQDQRRIKPACIKLNDNGLGKLFTNVDAVLNFKQKKFLNFRERNKIISLNSKFEKQLPCLTTDAIKKYNYEKKSQFSNANKNETIDSFEMAESLANMSLTESVILNQIMRRKREDYMCAKDVIMTDISMEEQKLLQSIDRLDKKLDAR
ncbi:hypothetical protein A3Q56_06678 [Intoshia linei]|uniref:Uncharacterized protein n=1 Tax=Intoshia linei TaxID=1819745 RepID=A0A177AU72_9BILA|nr:hypothetical protein A3Q56_06678 [Intoshia linei]